MLSILGFAIDSRLTPRQQLSTAGITITTPIAVVGGADADGKEMFCVYTYIIASYYYISLQGSICTEFI